MENATQALIIVFAVFVFAMALTVTIVSFNNAKNAADTILYTKDEINYYDYINVSGKADENRIVGLETIIPTLYNYYNEDYTVVFKKGRYNKNDGTFDNWEYLPVYQTMMPTEGRNIYKNWNNSYSDYMIKKYNITDNDSTTKNMINNGLVFSFDQYEEVLRYEPWIGSKDRAKINIDCFLYGKPYKNQKEDSDYIDYGGSNQPIPFSLSGFIEKCSSQKYEFIETIKEYIPKTIDEKLNESEEDIERVKLTSSSTKDKSKRMIIFTLNLKNEGGE